VQQLRFSERPHAIPFEPMAPLPVVQVVSSSAPRSRPCPTWLPGNDSTSRVASARRAKGWALFVIGVSVVVLQASCWCLRSNTQSGGMDWPGSQRLQGVARPGSPRQERPRVSLSRRVRDSAFVRGAPISNSEKYGLCGVAVMALMRSVTPMFMTDHARIREWIIRVRPLLLVVLVVLQKCLADALTWYTRTSGGTPYSGLNVALLGDLLKFPCLAVAVAVCNGPRAVLPTAKDVLTQRPFAMAWVGAAYAAQNVMYFVCLAHITASGYQVLSQSKLLFTAGLMRVLIGKKFSPQQVLALMLLLGGTIATQMAEASGPVLGSKGNVYLGGGLTVLSALLSALPNVFYESRLKGGKENEWVLNAQLTVWITAWVFGMQLWSNGLPDISTFFVGFTPLVWVIILLKVLNCILVPACLKYADNIMYGYCKPLSILLTCVVMASMTSSLPSLAMFAGVAMVLASMPLYSSG